MNELALAGISLAIWLLTMGLIVTTGVVGASPADQGLGRFHQLLLVGLSSSACFLLYQVLTL